MTTTEEARTPGQEDLARAVVRAWEALPGGHHPHKAVEEWLTASMWPVIQQARAALAAPRADSVERTAGEDLREILLRAKWIGQRTTAEDYSARVVFDTQEEAYDAYRALVAVRDATPAPSSPGVPDSVRDLSEAAKDVLAERHRQGKVEGWTTESDDQYAYWEMTRAAVCYAQQSAEPKKVEEGSAPYGWPWHSSWWKPTTPRRNLVKAGALILAEIERIDRAAHPAGQSIGPGAERDQVDAGLIQMLIADNARMRAAGTKLSEASLRVIREYDGTHRLSLAVAEWAEAIASEGGRAERFKPAPDSTRTGQVGAKWVMVPAEPTQAMWAAFRNADAGSIAFTKAYHAMIAARPAAPEAQGAEHPDDSTIGTAVQAIEWAIGIDDHYDRLEFLKAWSEGDLKEWPDFATFVHGTEPAPPASSGQESAR